MRKVKGDLIELAQQGHYDAIVHGCNCFCTMGAGIAKQIKAEFRAAYLADCRSVKGDRAKLGHYTSADFQIHIPGIANTRQLFVINAYTQFDYKGAGVKVDYSAIEQVFRRINLDFKGSHIGIPLIGAGLAGGNWSIIEKIIVNELTDCAITFVEFEKQILAPDDRVESELSVRL